MRYQKYMAKIINNATSSGAKMTAYGKTDVGPLIRFTLPGYPTLCIVTGQHGEEPAGPAMMETYLLAIISHAKQHKLGLVIYPCVNPEGYEKKQRYDDHDADENDTNSFLDYEVDGKWVDVLKPGQSFDKMRRSTHMAHEDRKLYDDIIGLPHNPLAVLDIHETDHLDADDMFAYVTGPREPYAKIMNSMKDAKPWRNKKVPLKWTDIPVQTDDDGLIELHDGTLTDFFYRLGSRYTVCLETSRAAPVVKTAMMSYDWVIAMMEMLKEGAK